jgi:hypothetical protein
MSGPFSRKFVLDVTKSAIRHAITFSVNRTCRRIGEFQHDTSKSQELQDTLRDLSTMRQAVDAWTFD